MFLRCILITGDEEKVINGNKEQDRSLVYPAGPNVEICSQVEKKPKYSIRVTDDKALGFGAGSV